VRSWQHGHRGLTAASRFFTGSRCGTWPGTPEGTTSQQSPPLEILRCRNWDRSRAPSDNVFLSVTVFAFLACDDTPVSETLRVYDPLPDAPEAPMSHHHIRVTQPSYLWSLMQTTCPISEPHSMWGYGTLPDATETSP